MKLMKNNILYHLYILMLNGSFHYICAAGKVVQRSLSRVQSIITRPGAKN
jgi:hypothetical protein